MHVCFLLQFHIFACFFARGVKLLVHVWPQGYMFRVLLSAGSNFSCILGPRGQNSRAFLAAGSTFSWSIFFDYSHRFATPGGPFGDSGFEGFWIHGLKDSQDTGANTCLENECPDGFKNEQSKGPKMYPGGSKFDPRGGRTRLPPGGPKEPPGRKAPRRYCRRSAPAT